MIDLCREKFNGTGEIIKFLRRSNIYVSMFKGASKEIQDFIGNSVFPAFAKNNIKYFITITSKVSAITKMSVRSYSAKTGPNGLKLVELNSVADAITWLKANS